MNDDLEAFTTTPRYITSDVREGKMTPSEWRVYQWMRINANPYGIAVVDADSLRKEIYRDAGKNYITQILLSLRSKGYIGYKPRPGRKGSFEVHFGDWLSPAGLIKYPKYGTKRLDDSQHQAPERGASEEPATNDPLSKRAPNEKLLDFLNAAPPERKEVRGSHTDTQTQTENVIIAPLKGKIRTHDFRPKTDIEQLVHEVALAVGDEYVNPIMSFVRNRADGEAVLRDAYEHFQRRAPRVEPENPAAFFQQLLNEYDSRGGAF